MNADLQVGSNQVAMMFGAPRMDEGREDRTQIEDVITIPKTDHKVGRIPVNKKNTGTLPLTSCIRGPISGISVSTTGTVRASSCRVMLLDVTLSAHYCRRRSVWKPLRLTNSTKHQIQPSVRDARDLALKAEIQLRHF